MSKSAVFFVFQARIKRQPAMSGIATKGTFSSFSRGNVQVCHIIGQKRTLNGLTFANANVKQKLRYAQSTSTILYCVMQNIYIKKLLTKQPPTSILMLAIPHIFTFCLSRIFMAQKVLFSLCCASMTRPKDPVPRVFSRSKSSSLAVFWKTKIKASKLISRLSVIKQTHNMGMGHQVYTI